MAKKNCLKPISVHDKIIVKCGDAHPGIFARFLEHMALARISTYPRKQERPCFHSRWISICFNSSVSLCTAAWMQTFPQICSIYLKSELYVQKSELYVQMCKGNIFKFLFQSWFTSTKMFIHVNKCVYMSSCPKLCNIYFDIIHIFCVKLLLLLIQETFWKNLNL